MTKHGITHMTYAKVMKVIVDDPMPAKELALEVGVAHITAYRILRALKAMKVVHICGWEKDSMGRHQIPVFKFGEGKNKARPKKTGAEKTRDYRVRKQMKFMTSLGVLR